MAKIVLWGALTHATQGQKELQLDVSNVRQLLQQLGQDYPAMQPQLKKGVSVAINGEVFRDNWFAPIPADAEVFVLPKLAGG
ncbi:MoaD/ThiS family protein [Rhodovibrionaceae bacterium A322]